MFKPFSAGYKRFPDVSSTCPFRSTGSSLGRNRPHSEWMDSHRPKLLAHSGTRKESCVPFRRSLAILYTFAKLRVICGRMHLPGHERFATVNLQATLVVGHDGRNSSE